MTERSKKSIHRQVEVLLRKHKAVFEKGYGVTRGFKATVHLKQTGRPVFKKVHPAPFALRGAISAELVRVEAHNIVTEVDRSDWATPTVNIHKSDRSVRICGDYKVTVNPLVDADHYSLPTVLMRIFLQHWLGGRQFSKLDLSHAYSQLELDDQFKDFLTINTHQGLYRPNRLHYGVSAALAIFQRVMDQLLVGFQGVACYLASRQGQKESTSGF